MKENKQKSLVYILLACLVLALFYAIYAFILSPKWDEQASLEMQKTTLVGEESELRMQLKTLDEQQKQEGLQESELRLKVPEKRELSDFIRLLEQIEGTSQTELSNITFNNYDEGALEVLQKENEAEEQDNTLSTENAPTDSEQAENKVDNSTSSENAASNDSNTEKQAEEEASKQENATKTLLDEKNISSKMKLMSVTLTVSAEEEQEVVNFIQSLENAPRIIRIESVNYTEDNPEDRLREESATTDDAAVQQLPVKAVLQLTTFYANED